MMRRIFRLFLEKPRNITLFRYIELIFILCKSRFEKLILPIGLKAVNKRQKRKAGKVLNCWTPYVLYEFTLKLPLNLVPAAWQGYLGAQFHVWSHSIEDLWLWVTKAPLSSGCRYSFLQIQTGLFSLPNSLPSILAEEVVIQ